MSKYTFDDFYSYILSNFAGGLKLVWDIDRDKIANINKGVYDKETSTFYLEIEFKDSEEGTNKLTTEYVKKEDIN